MPMSKRLAPAALAVALLVGAAAVHAACGGGSDTPQDLTSIYETITFFPGSTIDGGPVAPAALSQGDIATFKNDRRMFLASSTATKDEILNYYAEQLPKLGWEKEDPPKPKAKDMQNYCSSQGLITCLGYTKDNVRMIVSAPIQLQLNTLATQGVSYHFHLEKR